MAENIGYIKLYRKLRDNELWKQRRVFSQLEAWLDILMEVRWKEDAKEVVIRGHKISVNYAESINSLDTWAHRWGWSKARVRRFLEAQQKRNAIRYENETITTRITVLNFKEYQQERNEIETKSKRLAKRNRYPKEEDKKKEDKNIYKEEDTNVSSLARSRKNGNGSKPPEIHLFTIPLVSINKDTGDPEQHPIYQSDLDSWQDTFPAVDVKPCVKYIRQWNIDNPKKRKTKAGIMRHITTWLAREQNKGGGTFKRDIATSSGTLSWAEKRKLQEQEKADDGSTVRAVH